MNSAFMGRLRGYGDHSLLFSWISFFKSRVVLKDVHVLWVWGEVVLSLNVFWPLPSEFSGSTPNIVSIIAGVPVHGVLISNIVTLVSKSN